MKLLKTNIPKFDKFTAIVTAAIGLENLPSLLGIDMWGMTLAWLIVPGVLIVSFKRYHHRYISPHILGWIMIFILTILCYFVNVDWNENIPFMRAPEVIRSFIFSLVIFALFMVHGKSPEGRRTFFLVMLVVGIFTALVNIAALFGIIEKGIEITHIRNNQYITRISPLGDPNITTIYMLGLATAFPLWLSFLGSKKSMLMGLISFSLVVLGMLGGASRGGFLAVGVSFFVISLVVWEEERRWKFLLLFLTLSLLPFIVLGVPSHSMPTIFHTSLYRISSIADMGLEDQTLGARIGAIQWFVKEILSGPHLVGIGFQEYSKDSILRGSSWLPHNSFIDMYVIGGIIGFITYVLLWIQSILAFWRASRSRDRNERLYGKCGLAFGIGLSVLLMSVSISFMKVIWAYLGISMALLHEQKRSKKGFKRVIF